MSSKQMLPTQIAGYQVLPISLPSLPAFPESAIHYLYLSPHEPRIPTPTAPRSLFLVNIPFDSTETHIKSLLSAQISLPAGRIEDIHFEDATRKPNSNGVDESMVSQPIVGRKGKKRKRGADRNAIEEIEGAALPATWDRELHLERRTAIVTFVDRTSMESVIKAVKRVHKSGNNPIWGEGVEDKVPALGLARYQNHHRMRYPDTSILLASVNTYMTAFAEAEAAKTRRLARQRQEPDEDGFVTVTRGGRTGPAKQDAAMEAGERQKKKQKGLEDFYRFQTREKRKARAGELMRKFEEDKEKVRRMKERRKSFKSE